MGDRACGGSTSARSLKGPKSSTSAAATTHEKMLLQQKSALAAAGAKQAKQQKAAVCRSSPQATPSRAILPSNAGAFAGAALPAVSLAPSRAVAARRGLAPAINAIKDGETLNRPLRVAVIGGGPSGACAAETLAKGGVETFLIERKMDNCKVGMDLGGKSAARSLGRPAAAALRGSAERRSEGVTRARIAAIPRRQWGERERERRWGRTRQLGCLCEAPPKGRSRAGSGLQQWQQQREPQQVAVLTLVLPPCARAALRWRHPPLHGGGVRPAGRDH